MLLFPLWFVDPRREGLILPSRSWDLTPEKLTRKVWRLRSAWSDVALVSLARAEGGESLAGRGSAPLHESKNKNMKDVHLRGKVEWTNQRMTEWAPGSDASPGWGLKEAF